MIGPTFSVCADVGSEQDHTVFTVLRRLDQRLPNPRADIDDYGLPHYGLVYLEEMPLKTPYPAVCDRAREILAKVRDAHFLVDATGVGNPVVQMMMDLAPIPIVIVTGHTVNARENGGYNVPKREIVTALQAVLHDRRLRIAPDLPRAERLREQILSFKMKPRQSGNMAFEAETERTHDDMVLSLAINAWYNERMYGYRIEAEDLVDPGEPYDPFLHYA